MTPAKGFPNGSGFEALGKEILANGVHYADAADLKAAEFIVTALNERVAFARLHKAAHAYLHAASERTARIAAAELREALEVAA